MGLIYIPHNTLRRKRECETVMLSFYIVTYDVLSVRAVINLEGKHSSSDVSLLFHDMRLVSSCWNDWARIVVPGNFGANDPSIFTRSAAIWYHHRQRRL